MDEDFYWSPIDETGPFGSDAGSDAAHGFSDWRMTHPTEAPLSYLKALIDGWQYPYIALDELDTAVISKYLTTPSHMDGAEIERNVQLLKEYNQRQPLPPGRAPLTEQQLRDIVITSSKGMGVQFLVGIDNAIIGTAFAQFAMEGQIDSALRALADIAIKRELSDTVLDRWDAEYRDYRKTLLDKMRGVLNKMQVADVK